ncbi:peptidoglycan bridge formation glycyltransferase FemA/FemB family protein [Ruminococcaceae bacterium OttesenSCG-928-N02]|nr:peptidoglycan bridge formation glycyltransferase FemA/FemB family protein [Ruminococcaceae bacterium OttesenSCG-928-N02]
MYEILHPREYALYDEFVQKHKMGYFTQGTPWAKVKDNWGHEVVVCRNDAGEIVGGMLILIRKIGIKTMLYAPRGPICEYTDSDVLTRLLAGAREVAKKYKAYVLKMDPYVVEGCEEEEAQVAAFAKAGCTFVRDAAFFATIQPRHNYMMTEIGGKTPEEVLKGFGGKTRYQVTMPQRKGVVCVNKGLEGMDDFYAIYKETGERQKFTIRSREYLEKIMNVWGEHARLYMCYFEGKPLCGGIAVQYAGKTSHLYGCSSEGMRNLNPTYLLQWGLINWALEGNCTIYDMQGIALREEDSKELAGVYVFKKKFTGRVVTTVAEFEVIYDKAYNRLANFAMKLRTALKKRA